METIKTNLSTDLFADFIIENDPANIAAALEAETSPEGVTKINQAPDKNDILEINKNTDLAAELEKALMGGDEDEEEQEDEKVDEPETEKAPEASTKDEEDEDQDQEDEGSYSFKALASYLSDQGVIEFEDSEDLEDTPEVLAESIQKTVYGLVEEYKESLPSVVADLVNYIEKGGDPSKYLETIQKPFDINALDLEEENDQKLVLTEYLKMQDYTQEEIDEKLQDYEDAMLLEKESRTAIKKLEKVYEKKQATLLKEQEAQLKAQEKASQEYISTLQNTIKSANDFAGIPIDDKKKKEFELYLLQRDKAGLTAYQKELNEDPIKTQLELAYLKFIKYNFKEAKTKAKSEVTKDLKKIFKSTETSVKGKSRQPDTDNSRGADLSAFRGIFK